MKPLVISQKSVKDWFCNCQHICWMILIIGCILRFMYAAQVSYNYSPHDLGRINTDDSITSYGHLAYIQYLYLHRGIPDTYRGQFYQPPLFHLIGALVLSLFHVTDNYETAFEALQMVNMFFANIGIIYGYCILNKIGKKDWVLVTGTAFLSFCPAFYIIGAELNNDCLATLFLIMALYYTLCWIEKQNIKNIIKIALCIGLGMLTKTNGALIAFSVGLIFLYMLVKNRKEWKMYLKQFSLFGIVCIPLGIGWNIYRLFKYNISLTYVPRLSEDNEQFIGNVSPWTRLDLPSVRQLTSYRIDWSQPVEFSNIWGQTFLTMNFDEGILQINGQIDEVLAVVLLRISMLLSILLFSALLWNLFSSKTDVSLKLLFPINFLIIYGNFINFAFGYPHICTMNFRYIVIVQVLLIGGYVIYHKNHLINGSFDKCIGVCVVVQSVLASYLYLVCAV